MIRHLRWQIALALAGTLLIGLFIALVSHRVLQTRPAQGGQYVEAVVGPPGTFNPLLAQTDAEVDSVRLLFSGLTRPGDRGLVEPDLAERWAVSADGRAYTFTLRADAVWHDLEPVTADDVVFTARLAADPAIPATQKSRLCEPWQRVEVSALDARTVEIRLKEPYAPFLNATALGILPAHVLADANPADIPADAFSSRAPIGSGPYRLETIDRAADAPGPAVRFARFDRHWAATEGQPYLDSIVFQHYPNRELALEALGQRSAQGLGWVPTKVLSRLGSETPIQFFSAIKTGYTLVYLSPVEPFTNKTVRQALAMALDRQRIIDDPALLDGQAVPAAGPIAPGSWAYFAGLGTPIHDPEQARRMLDEAGWIDSEGDGVRDRDGQPLSFGLSVKGDDPVMLAIAERLREDWQQIGVAAEILPIGPSDLASTLRNRSYSALLFSWDLRDYDPDPYALWHSSQADFPGQNYAGFKNTDADRILVEARQAHPVNDHERRRQLYAEFQRIFAAEQPALVLWHPVYNYAVVDDNVGGIQLPALVVEPADRFATLPSWFVRVERVFGEASDRR